MSPGRVLGWDLLRGLCALAVASYHLMVWQGLADLPTLATYGVYLFFLLSGASLAYVYGDGLRDPRSVAGFLVLRWLRLAPLYLAVCVGFLAMLAARDGAWTDQLGFRLALNASFAFGLYDPGVWALAIGGWSLGIEFVFYLAMPALVRVLPRPGLRWVVLALLVAVQAGWIAATVGAHGLAAASVAYHQVPAFGAYFFAGCLVGWAQRRGLPPLSARAGAAVWLAMGALLLALAPAVPGDELVGWRGVLLPAACALCVWASGRVVLSGRAATLAAWLGDVTYGAYLLHPMVFFGFTWFVLPAFTGTPIEQLPAATRWAVLAGGLAVTCALARASERWFERPLRSAGRRLLPTPSRAGGPARPARTA
ncbi:acyltransferase family protein [Ramlibacter sp. MAHUQ-53]|uniref:acyltransferase family protein n=1 Tax=unclassified Ramlibacter TaxID=2617605 RepID=UPI0036324893